MSDWMKTLNSYEDAVKHDYDAFAKENCIFSSSPYFNWIFANRNNGIPRGTGVLLFSEPKAGKSLAIQGLVAQLHMSDPEAIAIVFNTEMRGKFQKGFFEGVDPKRVVVYDTNRPEDIFDRLEKEIFPMVQDGMPLKLVAFDSITMIGGTKSQSGDRSVNDHLVGDKALTVGKGWEKVIPLLKRHMVTYVGVEQMRMNVDTSNPHGPKTKMAGTFMTKHVFEYFISIKRAGSADDKKDLAGNDFAEEGTKDARGNKLATGHKIYFKMEESSLGPAGRSGVLTVDYKKGFINVHEEVTLMGIGSGAIKADGGSWYKIGEKRLNGKKQVADYVRENPEIMAQILADVIALDADLN